MRQSLIGSFLVFQGVAIGQIYSKDAGFFDPVLTANDYKFIMIEVVTILVAVLMMYNDKHEERPNLAKICLAILLALLFVFLVYEYAISNNLSAIIGMGAAFFLGVFSMDIMKILKMRVPEIFSKLEAWIFRK